MEPEPRRHSHLFVPILNEIGPCSIVELKGAIGDLPRKQLLVESWVTAAYKAGIVERAQEVEAHDSRGRPVGDRKYRLTMAGGELADELHRLTLRDGEFLERLSELGPGQTAESLSTQSSQPATEFVELWMESAFARGLIASSERSEAMYAEITDAGRQRLEEV